MAWHTIPERKEWWPSNIVQRPYKPRGDDWHLIADVPEDMTITDIRGNFEYMWYQTMKGHYRVWGRYKALRGSVAVTATGMFEGTSD